MSAWSDPPRLLEGTLLSDEDRRALSAYASDAPGADRRARMFEGLQRELEPSVEARSLARERDVAAREQTVDGAAATSTVRWGAGKLKLALVSAGLLASALGLLMWWPRHVAVPRPRLQSAAKLVAPTSRSVPALAVARPVAESTLQGELPTSTPVRPPVTSTQPESPSGPRERSKPKRPRSSPVAPAEAAARSDRGPPLGPETPSVDRGSDPVAELALLARARRALLVRPAHALEFTEAHARDFPHGTFGEEREVLAIEALLRLGLDDEAKQRAMAFELHFPNSAHRAHLARMIHPLDP